MTARCPARCPARAAVAGKMAADSSDGEEEDLVNYGTALQPLQEGKGAQRARLDYSAFLARAVERVSGCPGGAACRSKAARPKAGSDRAARAGPVSQPESVRYLSFIITFKPCAVSRPCSTLVLLHRLSVARAPVSSCGR